MHTDKNGYSSAFFCVHLWLIPIHLWLIPIRVYLWPRFYLPRSRKTA